MRRIAVCLATVTAALIVAAPAAGVKLGRVAPADTPKGDTCGACVGFQSATAPASPSYALPSGKWTLDSWRTRNTTGKPVDARLDVFRATQNGHYKVVGQSKLETIPKNSAPAFKTHLRVRKGDMLGLDPLGHMVTSYDSPNAADTETAVFCHAHRGDVVPAAGCGTDTFTNDLVNVAAKAHRR
jgi:hypothetical protein